MLNSKLRVCLFILPLSVLLIHCYVLNPKSIEMVISIAENTQYFDNDTVRIDFNYDVDRQNVEDSIMLKINNQITNINFKWDSNKVVNVSPESNWKFGYKYLFSVDGNIQTLENGKFYLSTKRHFIYGREEEIFKLEKCPEKELESRKDSLIFVFNKAVDQNSFISGFTVSPYSEYEILFSNDNKTITVKPKKDWTINSFLTWTLFDDIESADHYVIKKRYTGDIKSIYDLELPELLCVCPVALNDKTFIPLKEVVLNELFDDQAIYFEFTKPMNFESIENGILFEPSIKGCFYKFGTENKEFIFQPYENYALETKYNLKISDSCKDVNDIELYKTRNLYFYSANEYLEVSSIKIDSSIISDGIELCNENDYNELKLNEDKSFITITIMFSQDIKNKNDSENNISLTMLFPHGDAPEKQSCVWSSDSCVTLTYEGIRAIENKQYFYKILIKGASSGIISKNNDYMKENKCVIFNTVL